MIRNLDWVQNHINLILTVMHPSVSDNTLFCLKGSDNKLKKKDNLKFMSSTTDMDGFMFVVARRWREPIHGRSMYVLWEKL